MPVLATLATINLVFGPESDTSLLDPALLRERMVETLADSKSLDAAVALADELEALRTEFVDAATTSLDAYRRESVKWESSATGLIEMLQPVDEQRIRALREIIRVRQALHDLLTDAEWQVVFG